MQNSKMLALAVSVGAVGAMTFAPAANAAAKEQTVTSFVNTSITGGGDTGEQLAQSVAGNVSPGDHTGEKVIVKYAKKNHGHWTVLGTRHAKIVDSTGLFFTHFDKPATKGICQLVAKYKGNRHFRKSHAVSVIDCATGQPQG